MMTEVHPKHSMKPKIYSILEKAIEDGIRIGYPRAFNHDDNPSEDVICERIHTSIMNELSEYFDFE